MLENNINTDTDFVLYFKTLMFVFRALAITIQVNKSTVRMSF